jgi:hypothetical protein
MKARVHRYDGFHETDLPLRCYIRPILDDTSNMPHDMPHCCILQRHIKPTVDFKLLAVWLKTCDQEHSHYVTLRDAIQNRIPLNGIRFIDVARRRIVESPPRRKVRRAELHLGVSRAVMSYKGERRFTKGRWFPTGRKRPSRRDYPRRSQSLRTAGHTVPVD